MKTTHNIGEYRVKMSSFSDKNYRRRSILKMRNNRMTNPQTGTSTGDKGRYKAPLLDLSAAFDCVDHEILLARLERTFRLSGNVLCWLRSFLSDRTQRIAYCDRVSEVVVLLFGVPCLLYTSPSPRDS